MSTQITLHPEHEIDPTVTTARLHCMRTVRDNYRRAYVEKHGVLRATPLLDAAIERLEDLLAMHLPVGPGGAL